MPANSTLVAWVKPVPVMVTVVPGLPLVGVKLVMVGMTEKEVALVVVAPETVTLILPVLAAGGTVGVMVVGEVPVDAADAPWKATDDAPVNPDPVIVTAAPTRPLVGVKPVIDAPGWKDAALVAVPF